MRPLPGWCLDCRRFRRVRVEMLAGIPLGHCSECEDRLGPPLGNAEPAEQPWEIVPVDPAAGLSLLDEWVSEDDGTIPNRVERPDP